MAVEKNVILNWVAMDPERGKKFKNDPKSPEKWQVQMVVPVDQKARAYDIWRDQYGLKIKVLREDPKDETSDVIGFGAYLSAYTRNQNGDLNEPLLCISMGGKPIPPNKVGNGSIGNVMFDTWEAKDADKTKRTKLKGIQVKKWLEYERDEEKFEVEDDGDSTEIVKQGVPADGEADSASY